MVLEKKHLYNFISIYDDNGVIVNDIPKNILITVYCDGTDGDGYLENIYRKDLGINLFIAKKWQYQSVVNDMLNK